MAYLNTSEIRIYPSTNRSDTAEHDGTNIVTENNLASHLRKVFNHGEGFVVSSDVSDPTLTFYLGGYLIEANMAALKSLPDAQDVVYAHCFLNSAAGPSNDSFYYMEGEDFGADGSANANKSSFISFDNIATGATFNLQILDNTEGSWAIPTESLVRFTSEALPMGNLSADATDRIPTASDVYTNSISNISFDINTKNISYIKGDDTLDVNLPTDTEIVEDSVNFATTDAIYKADIQNLNFTNKSELILTRGDGTVLNASIPAANGTSIGVITNTAQTLKGIKTFTDGIRLGSNTSHKVTGIDNVTLSSNSSNIATSNLIYNSAITAITFNTSNNALTLTRVDGDLTTTIPNASTASPTGLITNVAQSFGGVKTFTNGIKLGTSTNQVTAIEASLTKNASNIATSAGVYAEIIYNAAFNNDANELTITKGDNTGWRKLVIGNVAHANSSAYLDNEPTFQVVNTSNISVEVGGKTSADFTVPYAVNASNDSDGNDIKSTYAASLSVANATLTLKNKNNELLNQVTVNNISNAAYASHIGTSTTHPAIGNSTKPVYVDDSGIISCCSDYAGGTAITLNNVSKSANTARFYAPVNGASKSYYGVAYSNQVLLSVVSTEPQAPTWSNSSKGNASAGLYLNGSGVLTPTKLYAGGTAVNLNNVNKSANTASFYAPASGGTVNQVLISQGDGNEPTWSNSLTGNASAGLYLNANGVLTATDLYAGGTSVNLNNDDRSANTASFYAPTSSGTANQVLISQGDGNEPTWVDQGCLSVSTATTATNVNLSNRGSSGVTVVISAGTGTDARYTIPDATNSASGVITNEAQTLRGVKTFESGIELGTSQTITGVDDTSISSSSANIATSNVIYTINDTLTTAIGCTNSNVSDLNTSLTTETTARIAGDKTIYVNSSSVSGINAGAKTLEVASALPTNPTTNQIYLII